MIRATVGIARSAALDIDLARSFHIWALNRSESVVSANVRQLEPDRCVAETV